MEILLNEELHQYTVDGTVKPSVTEVLNEWLLVDGWYVNIYSGVKIPQGVFDDAGDFGRAVHKAAKFAMEGSLFKLPDELAHPVSELERWMKHNAIEPVYYEMKGYSKKLDVAGTLDLAFHMDKPGKLNNLNLVDYKTAASAPTVGPQTWAYEQIYREMTGYKGIIKRWVLYLPKKDGKYKFVELRDPYDEHYFRAMNLGYKWRRR